MNNYKKIKEWIEESEGIIIGASNGLDISNGYNQFKRTERFIKLFKDYEDKYNFHSLIEGGFYKFSSDEEKWGYISKVAYENLYSQESSEMMNTLYEIVKNKPHFVITSNVNDHFALAGFNRKNIFEIEGSYAWMQCSRNCHNEVYNTKHAVLNMIDKIDNNLEVPSNLLPRCPKCGNVMNAWVATDYNFLQGRMWEENKEALQKFINKYHNKKILVLELGIGPRNTMIKQPLMNLVYNEQNARYVTINKGEIYIPSEIEDKSIGIDMDIKEVIFRLGGKN